MFPHIIFAAAQLCQLSKSALNRVAERYRSTATRKLPHNQGEPNGRERSSNRCFLKVNIANRKPYSPAENCK